MANYLKALRAVNIVPVPMGLVQGVCNLAEREGMLVFGGAVIKTQKGPYQWVYREAA